MKESTGELSMTVVTIIAIVAIAGVVTWLAPRVSNWIAGKWGELEKGTTTIDDNTDLDANVSGPVVPSEG